MRSAPRRFDDPAYVEDFKKWGVYPSIHHDIWTVISNWAAEREPAMDLGACTGLLSHRLAGLREATILAVEPKSRNIALSPPHPLVRFECMGVEDGTLPALDRFLTEVRPTLVVARRVLPEIAGETNVPLIGRLTALFSAHGVRKIVVEGRQPNPRATSPLADIDAEIVALSGHFALVRRYKNCALLARRTEI